MWLRFRLSARIDHCFLSHSCLSHWLLSPSQVNIIYLNIRRHRYRLRDFLWYILKNCASSLHIKKPSSFAKKPQMVRVLTKIISILNIQVSQQSFSDLACDELMKNIDTLNELMKTEASSQALEIIVFKWLRKLIFQMLQLSSVVFDRQRNQKQYLIR